MEESLTTIKMDCEEAVRNQEEASAFELNKEREINSLIKMEKPDAEKMMECVELNKETEINSLIKVEEPAAEKMMEYEEATSYTEESTPLDESKEEVERNSATQMEEADVVTLRAEDLMEVTDESSSADQSDQNLAAKETEASSDSVQGNSSEEIASPNLILTDQSDVDAATQPIEAKVNEPVTIQTVVSPTTPIKINLEEKESKQDSSSNLPLEELCSADQAKSLVQKPSKITKTISLAKTTAAPGKLVNIKILSKDEKVARSVTISLSGSTQTPVKYVSAPNTVNNLAVKKPPIILPKPPPLSASTAATASSSSFTSSQPSTLHKVLVPKNYVLVQTSTGLSFALADQVQNGAIKTSGPQNVSTLKTANSSSVSIVNTPITGKASRPKTSVLQQVKVPIQPSSPATKVNLTPSSFRADSVAKPRLLATPTSSPLLASSMIGSSGTISQPAKLAMNSNYINRGAAHDHTEAKKVIYPGECEHPTCCTYRDKVHEELRLKLNNRTRKIKSTRTAKERCVKRAALQMITMKNLQRQRAVHKSLESFPEGLCHTLMRAQLKPNEGVRAKRQYEKQLKTFATQLHSISPQAYNYVRSIFNKVLPESKSIHSWNFSGAEDVAAESVDESKKAASTDEEEETEGDESEGDEEMLEEEDEEEL